MKKILKRIFIVTVILALLVIAWRVSLFVRVISIEKKTFENFNGDYYYKITSDREGALPIQHWSNKDYKKLKRGEDVEFIKDKTRNIVTITTVNEQAIVQYGENFSIFNIDKFREPNSYITHWSWEYNVKYPWTSEYTNFFGKVQEFFFSAIVYPIVYVKNISTEEVNGKECYKIETIPDYQGFIYYVEKETHLLVRTVERQFYIIDGKEVDETYIEDYEYSFDPITNESLNLPNMDNYYVNVRDNM